jgi:hypothetical protein
MRQYPGDDRRIFDAGQHLEFSLASGDGAAAYSQSANSYYKVS